MATLEFWPWMDAPATSLGVTVPLIDFEAAIEWLKDESRPGAFTYSRHGKIPQADARAVFWFTDPNVAFEFKLTWG